MIPNVLSIAGSDPSGGAGIQADLKTFSALGCYGMAAITALTAQNTKGVTGVHELPAEFVGMQLESIFQDIRVDAVKIGMAGSVDTIKAIANILQKYNVGHIVLDPVMVAQSGDRLLSDESVDALKRHLISLAAIVTPNIPEAEILTGGTITDMQSSARGLLKAGARAVLLKGGHNDGPISFDVYADAEKTVVLEAPRIKTTNNHGTGCTLSSALAANLAKGMAPEDAVRAAKNYITEALRHSEELQVGHGCGPVHHFYDLWDKKS